MSLWNNKSDTLYSRGTEVSDPAGEKAEEMFTKALPRCLCVKKGPVTSCCTVIVPM
jgi:hypothetical protein